MFKKLGRGKTALLAAALVFTITAGSIAAYTISMFGTALTLSDAFENFTDEFVQRIETTPLSALSVLNKSMEEGLVTLNVSARENSFFGLNADLNARFYSDMHSMSYAMLFDANFMGNDLGFGFFI